MEKLSFIFMHGLYSMESKYIIDSEENYCSVFGCKMHVDAQYETTRNDYTFIINRSEPLLNGNPAKKLMDRIMLEAGNSYYPLHLRVSPQLWITDVANFNEIKQRWQTGTNNLLKKYPSPELERYFRFSEKNMTNSKTFISSLYRNTFYNLYFRDIYTPTEKEEVRLIRWFNFPKRETEISCLYRVKPEGENRILLSGEVMKIIPEHNGTYESRYETGDKGEIRQIEGKITVGADGKHYVKQFVLKKDILNIIKQDSKSLILDE